MTHQTRTKQHEREEQRFVEKWTREKDEWVTTWEEIERWSIDPERVPVPAWDSMEQCEEGYRRMEEWRRYKGTRLAWKPERQPQYFFLGGGAHEEIG
jgi:hypothetical protein